MPIIGTNLQSVTVFGPFRVHSEGAVTFDGVPPKVATIGWSAGGAFCDNSHRMDAARRTAISNALTRLADGDRSAFAVLMTELWPVVLAFVRKTVREAADAEDVAQEVFVKVAARISDYDRSREGLTWVYAIAAFEIRTHLRRVQRRREAPAPGDDAPLPDPSPSQIDLMIDEEISRMLAGALGELTDAERALLGLGEGSIEPALAGATIRKRRQRALGKLRTVWSRLYG